MFIRAMPCSIGAFDVTGLGLFEGKLGNGLSIGSVLGAGGLNRERSNPAYLD
jgi:hypothetical protein